ncbi:MAG: sigma-70 family RNA polymerase sigma factor [Acidobacteriota bacterium]
MAQRASSGDALAWDQLVERFSSRVYNLAWQFGRGEAVAEELTQDVFLKLYRKLHLYRGDVPLDGWVLRLSRNLFIEHYRRHRLEREAQHISSEDLRSLSAAEDPESQTQRRLRMRLVERALQDLPEELAVAVTLRDLQGLSYEDCAAFMEVPLGTLKSRLVRGRQRLARRVAQLLEPQPGSAAELAGAQG